MAKKDFNEFRFSGLNPEIHSNNYLTMNRVNEDENKIVVKVGEAHLFQTQYGYGLILDENHVVWLKDWQVDVNYFGNEVLLNKDFWNVKESRNPFDEFDENPELLKWEEWVQIAKEQQEAGNMVKWKK